MTMSFNISRILALNVLTPILNINYNLHFVKKESEKNVLFGPASRLNMMKFWKITHLETDIKINLNPELWFKKIYSNTLWTKRPIACKILA